MASETVDVVRPGARGDRFAGWGARAFLAAGLTAWTLVAAGLHLDHTGQVLDDGVYFVAARALRDGRGYELPSRPGHPLPKYPIGLPAAIALVHWLAPGAPSLARDVALARSVVLASGWVFFVAAFAWLRRVGTRPCDAALIVLATAFHHATLVGGAMPILSELPFCGVTYLLLARWAAGDRGGSAAGAAALDGVLAGLAVLLRSNGVTLVLAALAAAWLRRRRLVGVAACALGAALLVVPFQVYCSRHPRVVPSGDYLVVLRAGWSSAAAGLATAARNLKAMALDLPAVVVLPNTAYTRPLHALLETHPAAAWALKAGVALVLLVGARRLARASRPIDAPAWIHALGTVAVFTIWPWIGLMDRFLLGLYPMILLATRTGVVELARRAGAGRRARRRAGRLALVFVLVGTLSVAARSVAVFRAGGGTWQGPAAHAELDHALDYLRNRLEPDAVVAGYMPELIFLHTGRQAVPIVEDEDFMTERFGRRDRLELWMAQVPGRPFYLFVRDRESDPKRIDVRQSEALAADPGLVVREVYRSPGGRYRVQRVEKE